MSPPRDYSRISRGSLVAYGVSGFAGNTVGTCMGVHLFIFYTDTVGVAPLWISACLFVATLWDAITDPLMGQISDRTHWRRGRRRPFILLGALPFGLCFGLLFAPPPGLEGTPLGLYLGAALILLYSAATVVTVPALSLIPEMAQGYHERTRMAAYREGFGAVGDLTGMLLPFALLALLGAATAEGEAARAVSRRAYAWTALIGGGLAAAALVITWWGTYEDPGFRRPEHVPWRVGLRALRTNQPFRVLVLATSLAAIGLGFVGSMFLYILEYVVLVTDPIRQAQVFLANGLGALASYPFWLWCARTRGKPATFRLGLLISSLSFVSIFLLRPGSLAPLFAVMAFAGVANVGFWTLLYALNADLADVDELETGERREGIFAGVAALLRKCAFALAAACVGIGLEVVGYRANAVQTPDTILGLKILFALPTTLLVVTAWLVFRRFPLTRERHAALLQELDERRALRL
jgi:GPH family glycoside/pentoside/hexuronide:cation symporter